MIVLIALLICGQLAHSEDGNHYSHQEVALGRTVTMCCPLFSNYQPRRTWYKDGKPIGESDRIIIPPDGLHLTIRNAERYDSGRYTCVSQSSRGTAEAIRVLTVLIPPQIDPSNLIEDPIGIVGKSVSMECAVTGVPQPIITWSKHGVPIDFYSPRFSLSENNQTFGIHTVQLDDAGRYDCTAENRAGIIRQRITLEVIDPSQRAYEGKSRYEVIIGRSVKMYCPMQIGEVTARLWLKDGAQLYPNQRVAISSDGEEIQIRNAQESDAGIYMCRVIIGPHVSEHQRTLQVRLPSPPVHQTAFNTRQLPPENPELYDVWKPVIANGSVPTTHYWDKANFIKQL